MQYEMKKIEVPQHRLVPSLNGQTCPRCGSAKMLPFLAENSKSQVGELIERVGSMLKNSEPSEKAGYESFIHRCENCKQKIRVTPEHASPGELLEEPCTIEFVRKFAALGAAVKQTVWLNGKRVGVVQNGKAIQFQAYLRHNTLFVTDHQGLAFKETFCFEASPGERATITFKRKFLPEACSPVRCSDQQAWAEKRWRARTPAGIARGIDFEAELDVMRQNFLKGQRKMGSLPKPEWLIPEDTLNTLYEEYDELLEKGIVHYASIVQANTLLFEETPENEDHPADLLFGFDVYSDTDPSLLQEVAHELYSYKESDTAPEGIEDAVAAIKDELSRYYNLRIPVEAEVDHCVFLTAALIFREYIPEGRLIGNILPVIVSPFDCYSALILPKEFWTTTFTRFYRGEPGPA